MPPDFESHLGVVERSVTSLERDGQAARAVTLTRLYDTDVDDLWDAVINPERLPRWFLPVEGDLKEGGRYQLKGNAGGVINRCRPPGELDLTWEFGGAVSWVDLRLKAEGAAQTRLTLVHTAHLSDHWEQYGPGAVGIGWDLGLLGLALHLAAPDQTFNEEAFFTDPAGQTFILGSGDAWAEADIAGGEAPDQARASAERTKAFFTGNPPPET